MGCGRSGTSMVAGCLAGAGYSIGGKGHAGNYGNPKGYFETKEINGINDQILRTCSDVHFLENVNIGWLAYKSLWGQVKSTQLIQDHIVAIVKQIPFMFKDPRFSYTLPVWRRHLPADIKFVCMFRHPIVVATSILSKCNMAYGNRIAITQEKCFDIWRSMYYHILIKHVKKGNWLFLHYDQVAFEDGLDRLDQFLNTQSDKSFVDTNLCRATTTLDIPTGMKTMYGSLCDLANFKGDLNG